MPEVGGRPLLRLAQDYAKSQGVVYTRRVLESVRRAVHNLERKGEVVTGHEWVPSGLTWAGQRARTRGGQWRRMLFVGPPGSDALGPFATLDVSGTPWDQDPYVQTAQRKGPPIPDPQPPKGRRYIVRRRYCVDCGGELLGQEGLDDDSTVLRTAATAVMEFEASYAGGGKVVANDLCYGCWLERGPPEP